MVRTRRLIRTVPLLATAAALALPAAASADTLVTPAQGAQNLASGGGYLVWSAPAPEGGFQLTVRAPDGTVSTPGIARFRTAPDPAIGSGGTQTAANRPLVAVYSRDGDIHRLDLRTGVESKVAGASSPTYEETAPSIQYGRMTFVRRGGRDNGVFFRDGSRLKKISSARPRELVFNGSRVAYTSGKNIVIRNVSGRGRASKVKVPGGGQAFGLTITRYSLTFAVRGGDLYQTPRFGGSSGVQTVSSASKGEPHLSDTLNSVAFEGVFVRYYADTEGIKRIAKQNLFR